MRARDFGITVLPEYFQCEGISEVLDNVTRRAGATAIATSPYVMEPAPDGTGSREPPLDGGEGSVRLLDRNLWGKRALAVRTAPSFVPTEGLYQGLRYRPAAPDRLTDAHGPVVAQAIKAARERGLDVHLQVQAAIPPGYRVQFGGPEPEDRPNGPAGAPRQVGVDNNGSLASPHILAYTQALLRDLVRHYPDIHAIRVDWPEYPPYSFESLFFDFSPHAAAAMQRMDYDVERMRRDVLALQERLSSGLRLADLGTVDALPRLIDRLAVWLLNHRGVLDWLDAKARITTDFISACRQTVAEASAGRIGLMPQSFPPPWTTLSGFDFGRVAALGVPAIGVKLYTMHWPMIVRGYVNAIAAVNEAVGRDPRLGPAILALLDLIDPSPDNLTPGDIRYPEPDEPHPVGARAQAAKIRTACQAAGPVPVHAFAHGYGPLDDVVARATLAMEASGGRLWINRYGYLSDEKLDALGLMMKSAS